MRTKDIANLVSNTDLDAKRAIAAAIRAAFPGHEVLGEEANAGDVAADHLWIVAPLDGTKNFAHNLPHFAVESRCSSISAAWCSNCRLRDIPGDTIPGRAASGRAEAGSPGKVGRSEV
jgi:myo-inositol-1(or 4)-monophosphatase